VATNGTKENIMTTFNNPIDFMTYTTKFFKSIPKNAAEAKVVMEKVQIVAKAEANNYQDVVKTYAKASKGDASVNEIAKANKQAGELVKAATFATLLAMPGAFFALPLIIEKAKEYSIDLVPASVAANFDI
jgi:hypothetical protein